MKPFRVALSVRHKHVSSQKAYYGGNLLLLVKFERQEYSCFFLIFARKMGLHIRPETGSHAVCIWSAVSCEASARAKQLQGWCWWWALWETGHKSDGVTTKTFSYRRFFFSVVALMPSTLLCYYCRLCFFFWSKTRLVSGCWCNEQATTNWPSMPNSGKLHMWGWWCASKHLLGRVSCIFGVKNRWTDFLIVFQ